MIDIQHAEDCFLRTAGERPTEPYSDDRDPSAWADVAGWERTRADFWHHLIRFDDVGMALRHAGVT